jgi:hypothetical protein
MTEANRAEWAAAYPAVDVLGEARKALAWINANPTKRKTARGMARFLVSWMSRCQDKGGSSPIGPSSVPAKRVSQPINVAPKTPPAERGWGAAG